MRVIMACGGSGGHFFPALALADELIKKDRNTEVLFVKSQKPLERDFLKNHNYKSQSISVTARPPRPGIAFLKFAGNLMKGILESLRLVKAFKPDVVVGFGGYTSGPVVLVSCLLRKPVLVHEQNVLPGYANRIAARFANTVALAFDRSKHFIKNETLVVTGTPVRNNFCEFRREQALKELGLKKESFKILITGGSQGSHVINQAMPEALGHMDRRDREEISVIHLTGRNDFGFVKKEYQRLGVDARVFAFLKEVWLAYKAADLAITRCGASTISEIACCGLASILIPYPYAGNHQLENAKVLSDIGAAVVIEQAGLTSRRLKEHIINLKNDRAALRQMACGARRLYKPESAQVLADEVIKCSRLN